MRKFLFTLIVLSSMSLLSQENQYIDIQLTNISNDKFNDFAPTLYKDGILFLSDRDKSSSFFRLHYSNFNAEPSKIIVKDAKYHIGPVFYDELNDLVYLTKSNPIKNDNGIVKLGIYTGKLIDGKIKKLKS